MRYRLPLHRIPNITAFAESHVAVCVTYPAFNIIVAPKSSLPKPRNREHTTRIIALIRNDPIEVQKSAPDFDVTE